MSTKCTLSYGENYHLYEDCFEPGAVFLRLDKAEFEASQSQVIVRIPLKIWDEIRKHSATENGE